MVQIDAFLVFDQIFILTNGGPIGKTDVLGLVLYRKSTGGGRVHYLTLAACLAGLGMVPLATAITSRDMVPVLMLVLGVGYTAAVLLDDDEMRAVMKGA